MAASVPTCRFCPSPASASHPARHVCMNSQGEDQCPISQRWKLRPRVSTHTWGWSEGAEFDPSRSGWRPALPPGPPWHTMSTCCPRVHSMPLVCPVPQEAQWLRQPVPPPGPHPSAVSPAGLSWSWTEGQATGRRAGGPCHRSRGLCLSTERHARPRARWGGPSPHTWAALLRGQGRSGTEPHLWEGHEPRCPPPGPLRCPGGQD